MEPLGIKSRAGHDEQASSSNTAMYGLNDLNEELYVAPEHGGKPRSSVSDIGPWQPPHPSSACFRCVPLDSLVLP